jgi:hypothetical protein
MSDLVSKAAQAQLGRITALLKKKQKKTKNIHAGRTVGRPR